MENQIKGLTIRVHDHGFVRLVDWMGSDTSIVEAARVSYKSPSKGEEADKKLLTYLFKNKHSSPFEMAKIQFNIKMPIFVMRQYIRHRMQNLNEFSARYKELPDEFFIPKEFRKQATTNKQSSEPSPDVDQVFCSNHVKELYGYCYRTYQLLLSAGVAREQARIVLPVGIYTEFYACWDMNNLVKYFALRDDPHAQGEHQDYARAMKEITKRVFPWTMEVYEGVKFVMKEEMKIPV